jgi:phosphatidylinositol alpha-1,6-mannosyltransferase
MTTLVISEVFPPRVGGSGRWLWELYRRLPREQFVLAVGQHPNQEHFDQTHDLQITRIPLTLPELGFCSRLGALSYWRALRAVQEVASGKSVVQIHAGRCVPEGWLALLLKYRRGLPYSCYVHGEEVELVAGPGTAGLMTSRQLRWMTWAVLRGAETIIANSSNSVRILREEWRLPSDRIRLLHPGVDIERFVPASRNSSVRAELRWGDRPVILTVARLQKRKGHDQMIMALHRIRAAVPNVLYAIVGDGDERSSLEELVAREQLDKHVQFLGELDEDGLNNCYQQCDLFVLPNRQVGRDIEGFGMVLLEAQACGRPVVAGASGGTSEAIRIPETGMVVSCERPDELAALVTDLLTDRKRLDSVGQAARSWVVEQFDSTKVCQRAQRIFEGG